MDSWNRAGNGFFIMAKLTDDDKLNIIIKYEAGVKTFKIVNEYEEKKKIEYERDYDILTELLNRRGLYNKVNDFMKKKIKMC